MQQLSNTRDTGDLKERRAKLSPEQYAIAVRGGTEAPFRNAYWDHHEPGIYVDVVSGEPLFSSLDKFDSGTGWPSFTKSIAATSIVQKDDTTLGMTRTEVRSRQADSHLGHLFDDGPAPTGQRYCINSASLRFIPAQRLADEGYGQYAALFAQASTDAQTRTQDQATTAILAGGCFWGVEDLLRKLQGVIATEVGYTGGDLAEPTYRDVSGGDTGHAEAVRITFDARVLRYEDLLRYFFRLHDPTTKNRQGNDVGTQYRSAIFALDETQHKVALRVKEEVERSGKWKGALTTEIVSATKFYPAEEGHQDYLVKNPGGYTCHYLRE